MNVPAELKYTKSDEWIKVEGNIGIIGITDFAQSQLSDIVFVEALVDTDDEVSSEDSVCTVESVKAAADVSTPVSGKVLEINEGLADTPELINSDPYGAAWMIKIEISDVSELDSLLDAEGYKKNTEEQEH